MHPVPSKVKFFLWLTVHSSILTVNDLIKRGHVLPICRKLSQFPLLHPQHLHNWRATVTEALSLCWVIPEPEDLRSQVAGWKTSTFGRRTKLLWSMVLLVVVWSIWLKRNKRTFQSHTELIYREATKAKDRCHSWVLQSNDFKKLDLGELKKRWEDIK